MTNWFGMPPHSTDSLIHWTEAETAKELAVNYRTAYDKIVAAGLQEELSLLLRAAYASGTSDTYDEFAGPEI